MSTHEEIMEVFEQDIRKQERVVMSNQGIMAFLEKDGMQIKDLFDGLVNKDDRELLQRILDNDTRSDVLPTNGGVTSTCPLGRVANRDRAE